MKSFIDASPVVERKVWVSLFHKLLNNLWAVFKERFCGQKLGPEDGEELQRILPNHLWLKPLGVQGGRPLVSHSDLWSSILSIFATRATMTSLVIHSLDLFDGSAKRKVKQKD